MAINLDRVTRISDGVTYVASFSPCLSNSIWAFSSSEKSFIAKTVIPKHAHRNLG